MQDYNLTYETINEFELGKCCICGIEIPAADGIGLAWHIALCPEHERMIIRYAFDPMVDN